ncbi:MAG: retropepsin-like aspartic protease family protein [Pseudomonadota bacterium]
MTPTFLRVLACLAAVTLGAVTAFAQNAAGAGGDFPPLVERWLASDAKCRNPATPAAEAVAACEQRDTHAKLLALDGYCHSATRDRRQAGWAPCDRKNAGGHSAHAEFRRVGGVFVMPAILNGSAPVYFIVDSGAATVQIPQELADDLRHAGTLVEADFLGQHRFILADGRTMTQRVFRLRRLQIGERAMENVLATVGAPRSRALLGQTFLRRLSWWKVDNVRNALEFEFTGAF